MQRERIEALKKAHAGPVNSRQLAFLRDLQAFIDVCVDNGLSFQSLLGVIAHDVNGLLQYGDDKLFSPQVTGYVRVKESLEKEMEAMSEDRSVQAELPG